MGGEVENGGTSHVSAPQVVNASNEDFFSESLSPLVNSNWGFFPRGDSEEQFRSRYAVAQSSLKGNRWMNAYHADLVEAATAPDQSPEMIRHTMAAAESAWLNGLCRELVKMIEVAGDAHAALSRTNQDAFVSIGDRAYPAVEIIDGSEEGFVYYVSVLNDIVTAEDVLGAPELGRARRTVAQLNRMLARWRSKKYMDAHAEARKAAKAAKAAA